VQRLAFSMLPFFAPERAAAAPSTPLTCGNGSNGRAVLSRATR